MKISVPLEKGMLPDKYGKHAPAEHQIEGHPAVSFPLSVEDVPDTAKSLALTFVDFDAIPVGGFCWIHWLACNFPPDIRTIPETQAHRAPCPASKDRTAIGRRSRAAGSDPRIIHRYAGPYPPDKDHAYTLTVYALDIELELEEGYYLNEFRRAIQGHVLEKAVLEVTSRSSNLASICQAAGGSADM